MSTYKIVASTDEATVVAEYKPTYTAEARSYQGEAALEAELIAQLGRQGYEYLQLHSATDFINNLRAQLERLNAIQFSDAEWNRFYKDSLANQNEGIVEKTRKIQDDRVQVLIRDDGSTKNITLLDERHIHNNHLQVINQYEQTGSRANRYDVTILVNGLPLVHVELKRRGVALREAFNQINRYQRESFWGGEGFFEYVQLFVISNGTHTKYYSNTTRRAHLDETRKSQRGRSKNTSHSFEFTSYWADAANKNIEDLVDFTRTFFSKHVLLKVLTRYCVFTSEELLLVMRPYQIAATEAVINRINLSTNYKKTGTLEAGGYIWHTTGSGKTLTSFKTALLATKIDTVDKVLFVVDRKDLDYQTMREYDRFQKGAANGNTSTRILQRQLEDRNEHGGYEPYKIIVTTIQKLDRFIAANKKHEIYNKHMVMIFDECHRSQFGEMHRAIIKHFKNYHLFGFTGTPIFAVNAPARGSALLRTTEQAFGDKLHTYTIVDAINDRNVLPFRIDFINTMKTPEHIQDQRVYAIDREKALADPRRIAEVVDYTLTHFDQKTKASESYQITAKWEEPTKGARGEYVEKKEQRRVKGFNSLFAVASINLAKLYYTEFKKQIAEKGKPYKIATIFSFSPNEEQIDGLLPDEDFNTARLDASSRDFLERAIEDYNQAFKTNFDTSSERFQNYYKDLSLRVKNREVDLLLVVDMFLTGFDATTLNTLWVDKNLRLHGLLQAFSRTNRILNRVKTFGNIICFRDLKDATDEAIALFGDKDAGGIVLLKTYDEYYNGYEQDGAHHAGYRGLIAQLMDEFPLGSSIIGEEAQKAFIMLFGKILRIRNILTSFDEFEGNWILSERQLQDYQSIYIDLYQDFRAQSAGEKESINDDIIFEIELIRQIEVNIDYILMLVARYKDSNCQDKEVLSTIDRAINASLELRSKKVLIDEFIAQVNVTTQVDEDWRAFLEEKREEDIRALIVEENLPEKETRKFVDGAFRDGVMRTMGTAIDKLVPPTSRFYGNRDEVKQTIIAKLLRFFEKYFGLV